MAITFSATTVANPSGVQGSYPLTQVPGHEGMLADLQAYVCRSYRNQTGAALAYGSFVSTDNTPATNDTYAVQLATGVAGIQGITVSSQVFEGVSGGQAYTPNPSPIDAQGRYGYPDKESVNVVSKGVIWVYSVEPIVLGDEVRFFIADETSGLPGAFVGRFGKGALPNSTVKCVGGARWMSETASAGLVMLEIDIPAINFTADV